MTPYGLVNLANLCSDNGCGRYQAITLINIDLLSIGSVGTNFGGIKYNVVNQKCILKYHQPKWRLLFSSCNVLNKFISTEKLLCKCHSLWTPLLCIISASFDFSYTEQLQAALISEVVAYERLESGHPIHHMLYIAMYIKQWSCLLWSRFVIARQNLDYLCM